MSDGATKYEPGERMKITVAAQTGANVVFAIKPTTPLSKIFGAYCGRVGASPHTVRFLYNGERLQPENTPKDIDMHDGDVVDAVLQQTGG